MLETSGCRKSRWYAQEDDEAFLTSWLAVHAPACSSKGKHDG